MMRSPAPNEYDRGKEVVKFSGDEPDAAMRFLDHDMDGQDYAEAKFGVIGRAIHRGTDPTVTAANLNEEATKLHRFINIAEGSKAGDAAWNNDDFWTAEYQNAFRLHWKRQLMQWQKHHSSGRYKAWLQDFKPEDLSRIRALAMREFGNVNQGVIAGWESQFRSGCPATLGGDAFPENINVKAKIVQLKRMQKLLVHMCPEPHRDTYPFAGPNDSLGDRERAKIYINHCHDYREVLNRVMQDAITKARNAGVQVPLNINASDHAGAWQPDVDDIEAALTAEYEQRDLQAKSKSGKSQQAIPIMMMNSGGTSQFAADGIFKGVFCNRCGNEGHIGTMVSVCPAAKLSEMSKGEVDLANAKTAIWVEKQKGGGHSSPSHGGKGGGKGNKKICRYYAKHGSCSYGRDCKFAHSRGKGGGKGGKRSPSRKGGKGKYTNNQMTSMIFGNIKRAAEKHLESPKRNKSSRKKKKVSFTDEEESEEEEEIDISQGSQRSTLLTIMQDAQEATAKTLKKGKGNKKDVWMVLPVGTDKVALAHVKAGSDRKHVQKAINAVMLHARNLAGADTCGSSFLTTFIQDLIPGLVIIDDSILSHVTYTSAGGPIKIGGIGPGGFVTNSTPTGEQLAILLPYGRWVDTGADANAPQFRILPLVMLAKMGVRLVQNHRGRDQSVLECMRTGRIVNMVSDNGILCLPTHKDMSAFGNVKGVEFMVDDVACGRISPIVSYNKHVLKSPYVPQSQHTLSCLHQSFIEKSKDEKVVSIWQAEKTGYIRTVATTVNPTVGSSTGQAKDVDQIWKPVALLSVDTDGVTTEDIANSVVRDDIVDISVDPAMDWKSVVKGLTTYGAWQNDEAMQIANATFNDFDKYRSPELYLGEAPKPGVLKPNPNDEPIVGESKKARRARKKRRRAKVVQEKSGQVASTVEIEDNVIPRSLPHMAVANDPIPRRPGGSSAVSATCMFAALLATLIQPAESSKVLPVITMKSSKLTAQERSRLWMYKLGFPAAEVPVEMTRNGYATGIDCTHVLNEDMPIKDKGKFKSKSFPRNDLDTRTNFPPFAKIYADGYGGQGSMGPVSYDGAVGGFVFCDVGTGAIGKKLYSNEGQFAQLFERYCTWVESLHFAVKELVVDAKIVMASQDVINVCAERHIVLTQISDATPQELSFAENAVGRIRSISRTLRLMAPHLPDWIWGLCDEYATYIHFILPYSSGHERGSGTSPYQNVYKRVPDLIALNLHPMGCPVQFKPGVKHLYVNMETGDRSKNNSVTHDGWFVGMQWPSVLVLRKYDMKVVTASRKHCIYYEGIYTQPPHQCPITASLVSLLPESDDMTEEIASGKPKTVPAVHSLREPSIAENTQLPTLPPLHNALESQLATNQGEEYAEAHKLIDKPAQIEAMKKLLEELKERKSNEAEPDLNEKLLSALKEKVAIKRNALAKGASALNQYKLRHKKFIKSKKGKSEIDPANIITDADEDDQDKDPPVAKAPEPKPVKRKKVKESESLYKHPIGTRVRILTTRFDKEGKPGSYSKGKPKYTYGTLAKKNLGGGILGIRWDDDDDYTQCSWRHLEPVTGKVKTSAHTILAMIVMATSLQIEADKAEKEPMPRWFFECLIRDDWRKWVKAVKRELEGWTENEAVSEVKIKTLNYAEKIIPLSELYSIKRDGRYKLRQIALGNVLRKGPHFWDTWSTTISGAGIRLFYSIACALGLPVHEVDVETAYLQGDRVSKMHAYKPSHYGYSCLPIEELEVIRTDLLKLVKSDGIGAVKALCRKLSNPKNAKTVLRLNVPVYGEPSAGQRFGVKMNETLTGDCRLRRCKVQPCFYVQHFFKRKENGQLGECIGYMYLITWSDDARYFGTKAALDFFESRFSKALKSKFVKNSEEFVSIEVNHDLEQGTLELTQKKYWEAAVESEYAKWFPNGPRTRHVPLPADTKVEPATDEEFLEAKDLPMKSVLGTLGFPAQHTKIEIRHALRLLQKHGHKWSVRHFELALQLLEYCYTTRDIGIIFSRNLDKHGVNILYAYADANLQTPKSNECSLVMMNGSVIAAHFGTQSTTAPSTMHAEYMSAFRASEDIVALRTLMKELDFEQVAPTRLYEDNQPCIHTANNPGALQKKSKTFDIQAFALRDRCLDKAIVMEWCESLLMGADLGTKLLPTKQFQFLRDLINGYALVRASGNHRKDLPNHCISMSTLMMSKNKRKRSALTSMMISRRRRRYTGNSNPHSTNDPGNLNSDSAIDPGQVNSDLANTGEPEPVAAINPTAMDAGAGGGGQDHEPPSRPDDEPAPKKPKTSNAEAQTDVTGELHPPPPALPSPRSDDGNSVTYSEVSEPNEGVVRNEIPDENPYRDPRTEEERFVHNDYGETRGRHVYSPVSDQESESRGQLRIGPVLQFRPPRPNINPNMAPAQFEAEFWAAGDKFGDSRNYVPSNYDSMWYLRHFGHREDSMIGRGVLNTQSEKDRRHEIRRLRDYMYQSRELHPANEIRLRLLQTRRQFIVELVNVRRALVRWVVYLQHRLLHDPDFDAITYLDENSHPDVVLAQYHDLLVYRFRNRFEPFPMRGDRRSSTVGKQTSDMANGGGGSSSCGGSSSRSSVPLHPCPYSGRGSGHFPENVLPINAKSMVYQGMLYQEMPYTSDVEFNPRALLPPSLPMNQVDGFAVPCGLNEYVFRIMWLSGMIPFGFRDNTMNRDGNSWVWIDIHENPAFRNDDDRDSGNGAGKEQTKD